MEKHFSIIGGRITLIQFCLSHIPSYFLSLFKIPKLVTKVEKLQWKGKNDHLISQDVVYRSKELGGLGFGKISFRNHLLLGK